MQLRRSYDSAPRMHTLAGMRQADSLVRGFSGLLAITWLLLATLLVVGHTWGGWENPYRELLTVVWLVLAAFLIVLDRWGPKSRVVGAIALGWLILASYLVIMNASRSVAIVDSATAPDGWGVRFNLYALGLAAMMSLIVGYLNPGLWRRAMLLLAALPTAILLFTSHNLLAGSAILALLVPTTWLGKEIAVALLREPDAVNAWTIGSAFGLGVIASLGFALGIMGVLRPAVIWLALFALMLALLARAHWRLRADFVALATWLRRPVARQPVYFLLAGIALAYFWLNLTGALAPETREDAVTQRLATAAYFARIGALAVGDRDLPAAVSPAVGEVIYAVALAGGPLQTAKLLNFLISLFCAAIAFAIGRRLAGSIAGWISAFTFYTMPLVFGLSQTALLDLFTTFFGLAAALVIVLRARPDWRNAVAAGIFLGLGLGVKIHFAYVAVGLAVAIGLLGLSGGGVVATARSVALLGAVSLLTAAPWLIRSYFLTGQVPGLELAVQSLTRSSGESPAAVGDLVKFGYGRSLADLVRAPFDITLRSVNYGGFTRNGGYLGYLWLGLIPLLIIARPGRRLFATLAAAATALILWFYTAQYLRYGLPIFALFCVVGGAAYGLAWTRIGSAVMRAAMSALVLVLAVAGVSIQVAQPNLSYPYAFGREAETTYLDKYLICCGNYSLLKLLNAQPDATRVFTPVEQARLYTRARLSSPAFTAQSLKIEADEVSVLARLDEGGYSHIMVDRRFPAPEWDRLTVIQEEFLRRNTALVGSRGNAYLYRLLPPEQRDGKQPWARGSELINNSGFEVALDSAPLGWEAAGQPLYDISGNESYRGRGAVRSTLQNRFITRAKVTPNTEYLLSHATRSVKGYGTARLQIHWLNKDGQLIGLGLEMVPVSPRGYHVRSMLATSPPAAAFATIHAEAQDGEVWFDEFSLRSIKEDDQTGQAANLLADGGFDGLLAGASQDWKPYGNQGSGGTEVSVSPLTPGAALLIWPGSGFSQRVPVRAGQAYYLSYTAWSTERSGVPWLKVNWLDENGNFLSESMRKVGVADSPATFSTEVTAPAKATYAEVYVSVHEGGPIWFDNYAFQAHEP